MYQSVKTNFQNLFVKFLVFLILGLFNLFICFRVIVLQIAGTYHYSLKGLVFGLAAYGVLAFLFLLLSFINFNKRKSYKLYYELITVRNITSIHEIASMYVGKNLEICIKDLQKMIDQKYFYGYYIDKEKMSIMKNAASEENVNKSTSDQRVVKCKNCGAQFVIKTGSSNNCEYCNVPYDA